MSTVMNPPRHDVQPSTSGMTEPAEGKCSALKQNGLYCANEAGKGCPDHKGYGRCYWHGGRTPSHQKNGIRQRAMGEAGILLEECRLVIEGQSTTDGIQRLRTNAASTVMALGVLVGQGDSLLGPDGQPNAYMGLYAEWVNLSAKVEKIAADLGLEERRVQVDETIASLVVAKVLETFMELGQDPAPYVALLAPKLAALDAVATTGAER